MKSRGRGRPVPPDVPLKKKNSFFQNEGKADDRWRNLLGNADRVRKAIPPMLRVPLCLLATDSLSSPWKKKMSTSSSPASVSGKQWCPPCYWFFLELNDDIIEVSDFFPPYIKED